MQYGFVLPVADPAQIAPLAAEVEQAGWDAVYVAEMIWGPDAWVLLAAAATKTERIKLGTMLTPPSRMRPWKLASETATLDRLSNGRVILAAGVGALDVGFAQFGEVTDRKTRVELMEESLELVQKLWKAERFSHKGKHYTIDLSTLMESMTDWVVEPVQQPRIPIWMVGSWRTDRITPSIERSMKYDGLIPNPLDADGKLRDLTPDDIRAIRAYVESVRGTADGFDIINEGETPDNSTEQLERIAAMREAGATWWNESPWSKQDDLDYLRKRIAMGPPKS